MFAVDGHARQPALVAREHTCAPIRPLVEVHCRVGRRDGDVPGIEGEVGDALANLDARERVAVPEVPDLIASGGQTCRSEGRGLIRKNSPAIYGRGATRTLTTPSVLPVIRTDWSN